MAAPARTRWRPRWRLQHGLLQPPHVVVAGGDCGGKKDISNYVDHEVPARTPPAAPHVVLVVAGGGMWRVEESARSGLPRSGRSGRGSGCGGTIQLAANSADSTMAAPARTPPAGRRWKERGVGVGVEGRSIRRYFLRSCVLLRSSKSSKKILALFWGPEKFRNALRLEDPTDAAELRKILPGSAGMFCP